MQQGDGWTVVRTPLPRVDSYCKGCKPRKQHSWHVGITTILSIRKLRSRCSVVCWANLRQLHVGGCAASVLLLLFLLLLASTCVLLASLHAGRFGPSSGAAAAERAAARGVLAPILNTGRDHLLVYAFSYTDPEFLHNLEYFIREAVHGDTAADFLIIVQEGPNLKVRCRQGNSRTSNSSSSSRSVGSHAAVCAPAVAS